MTSQFSPSGRSQKISAIHISKKNKNIPSSHFWVPSHLKGAVFHEISSRTTGNTLVFTWRIFLSKGRVTRNVFPQLINESIPRNCLGFMINSTNWAEVSSANLSLEVSQKTLSPPSLSPKYILHSCSILDIKKEFKTPQTKDTRKECTLLVMLVKNRIPRPKNGQIPVS